MDDAGTGGKRGRGPADFCQDPGRDGRGTPGEPEVGRIFREPPRKGWGKMKAYKESEPFYHRKEWKKIRADVLARDQGMCQDCMDKFRAGIIRKPRRATMVHHIIPRKERPDLALVMSNLRSLCATCHEEHHPERRSKTKRKTEERMRERGAHQMRVIKV